MKKRQHSNFFTQEALLDDVTSTIVCFRGPVRPSHNVQVPAEFKTGSYKAGVQQQEPRRVDVLEEVSWVFKVVDDPMMTDFFL